MRRPRFTIRLLMVLVAIAALAAWGVHLARRSAHARQRAGQHRADERSYASLESGLRSSVEKAESEVANARREVADAERMAKEFGGEMKQIAETVASQRRDLLKPAINLLETLRGSLTRWSALRRYHSDLAAKYERAARYPWLPVAPDPPPPE